MTHPLDAEPDYKSVLPHPSYAPLILAFACTVAFLGAVYDVRWVPVGGVLAFFAMVYWNWPGTVERTPPWKEAGRGER